MIDLDHLWLPEPLCRWGLLLGLALSASAGIPVLANHLIAACLALVLMESISALAERVLGQPALGLGDAKLAAMGGAWLGAAGIAAAMALAVVAGALLGSAGRLSGRLQPRQAFPFGPFIALGIGWSGHRPLAVAAGSTCWSFAGTVRFRVLFDWFADRRKGQFVGKVSQEQDEGDGLWNKCPKGMLPQGSQGQCQCLCVLRLSPPHRQW